MMLSATTDLSDRLDRYYEMVTWCDNTFDRSDWHFTATRETEYTLVVTWHFDRPEDHALFVLTWTGS